tara:strand:- start:7002 stop:7244 length:243 start_codon:yes stop_codon:yes gene_type:complete
MKKRNKQIFIAVLIAIALYFLYNYFVNRNKNIAVQTNEISQGAGAMTEATTQVLTPQEQESVSFAQAPQENVMSSRPPRR